MIENSPKAYGFLAGALVLLLGMLAANAGCRPMPRRDAQVAFESAVLITSSCMRRDGTFYEGYGSGVIVDSHTILTVAHVAYDEDICMYTALMPNQTTYVLMRGEILSDPDLATMKSLTPFAPTYEVAFAPMPGLGETVCVQTAYPRWAFACGERQYSPADGAFAMSALIEPGNSGSGVYDGNGRLVGIITHLIRCSNGQICAGRATALEGHLRELFL